MLQIVSRTRHSGAHPYRGCVPVLATLHKKERAIAPPFRRLLGLPLITCEAIDTDALGTFTGEIPRAGSMSEAAAEKARLASALTGRRLGVGSEGSFGPHPHFPFVALEREVVALYDKDLGITIEEGVASFRTNYRHLDLDGAANIEAVLQQVGFPDHALVAGLADGSGPWVKGITTRPELDAALASLSENARGGTLRIATDMRAHMNPMRMRVIRAAATRLARRIATLCPACGTPGYGIAGVQRGAACSCCGEPTGQIAATVHGCAWCRHSEMQPLRNAAFADPKYCPACNP